MIKYLKGISFFISIIVLVGCLQNKKDDLQANPFYSAKNTIEEKEKEVPGQFGILRKARQTAIDETEPSYPSQYLWHEFKKTKQGSTSRNTDDFVWKERGPSNFSGRTRAFYRFSKTEKETWLAGAATGGIWKTYDGGKNWENKTPNLLTLSISSIAASPSDEHIIYAGTGESFAGLGDLGFGILKSIDFGETWQLLENTVKMGAINRLVVDPEDAQIVLAASHDESSIYKTIDGGESWKKVYQENSNNKIYQIIADPHNFNFLFASIAGKGIIKSEDKGVTWFHADKGMAPKGRVEIALASSNPDKIYALTRGDLSGTRTDFYVSENKGATWDLLVEDGLTLTSTDFLGGQGTWKNAISVHPFDENIIYAGGFALYEIIRDTSTIVEERKKLSIGLENTRSFIADYQYTEEETYRLNIEIRFGPDKSQKAHRFTVPLNSGTNMDEQEGVDFADYLYEDIIDVPFEVWDIDNNIQLMVSIRDQTRNSIWDLNLPSNPGFVTREYIYIHDYPYDSTNLPHPSISKTGGVNANLIYFFWILNERLKVDHIPEASILFNRKNITYKNGISSKNIRQDAIVNASQDPYLHEDFHNILNYPSVKENEVFSILTNDGGVYSTEDFKTFDFSSTYCNTLQFYGVDKAPGRESYIGGTQDNGTLMSSDLNGAYIPNSYFRKSLSGDGFDVVWNKNDPNLIFIGYQYGGFHRSVDGGSTFEYSSPLLHDDDNDFPFANAIANAEKNPNTLFVVSRSGVWKSEDFGLNWRFTPVEQNFGRSPHIEISHANPQIVWAGGTFSETSSTLYLSKDNGYSFDRIKAPVGLQLGNISEIATHPTEASTAYLLFSFSNRAKILKTEDLGQTWTDISGFENGLESSNGFPNIGVNHLLVFPDNTDQVWVGTDLGIVESKDNGASWELLTDPFPHTIVSQLKYVDEQVLIATYGRGIWTAERKNKETGATDQLADNKIYLWPNPVKTDLNIVTELVNAQKVAFRVYDLSGRRVYSDDLGILEQGGYTHIWKPNELANGTYIIEFKLGQNKTITRKITYLGK